MENEITLVDRGRGLQLSTSRITVHDLVPYFQDGCSDDEMIRWLPSLTHEEIRIVERYYRQHKDELDEYESRIRAYRAEQVRLQRLRFPEREGSRHEHLAQLRQLLQQRRQENNGGPEKGSGAVVDIPPGVSLAFDGSRPLFSLPTDPDPFSQVVPRAGRQN